MPWDVAVKTLMMSLDTKEVCRRFGCGGGALAEPIDAGHVVRHSGDGAFTKIGCLRNDVVVSDVATQFQFAVVDGAGGIVEGNQCILNVLRKGRAPQMWRGACARYIRDKENATHAGTCCVARSDDFGVGRNELGNAGRAAGEIFS